MNKQTLFLDELQKKMHVSFEEGYYLESLTCSFAIIENRSRRLLEHLKVKIKEKDTLATKSIQLDKVIYQTGFLETLSDNPKFNRKLQNFIKYQLYENSNILDKKIPLESGYSNIDKNQKGRLTKLRLARNEITHALACFDDNSNYKIDDEHLRTVAYEGIVIAKIFCQVTSKVKKKIKAKL